MYSKKSMLSLLSMCLISLSVSAEIIAVRAGHIVDPEFGTVSSNKFILIENDKISQIVDQPPDTGIERIIDLSNSWVMPGLMDVHTHLTMSLDPEQSYADYYSQNSTADRTLLGLKNAQTALQSGFTTVRDLGNAANYADSALRRAIESGLFKGPTIINAGKIIAPFGGQEEHPSPDLEPYWHHEYIDADGIDEIRKAIRQNIQYGAKVIKIASSSDVVCYSKQELEFAAEETHRAGLLLAVHAIYDQEIRTAIEAGADTIEHGTFASDETLELLKAKGVYLVGTNFPDDHLQAMSEDKSWAAMVSATMVKQLRRAYRMGVPMAFGTDSYVNIDGKNRAQMMQDYFQVWLDADIPDEDILKAMTFIPAQLLHMSDERGAIREGFFADIIATPANPLKDINALKSVTFVMKNGEVIVESH